MGAPMASNLLKQDYDVTVYNRTHENAVRSPNREPPLRETPREAADGQDLVITMVSNDQSIRDVFYGENGLLGS